MEFPKKNSIYCTPVTYADAEDVEAEDCRGWKTIFV